MATVGFVCLPILVYVVMMFYEDERERELWRRSRDALRKWTKNFKVIVPAVVQLEAIWVLNKSVVTIHAGHLYDKLLLCENTSIFKLGQVTRFSY